MNTLANIIKEDDSKYLVLKNKYRVGTHLAAEIPPPNHTTTRSPQIYSQYPGSPDAHYNDTGYPPHVYSPNVSSNYGSPGGVAAPPAQPKYMQQQPPPSPAGGYSGHQDHLPPQVHQQQYPPPPPPPHHSMNQQHNNPPPSLSRQNSQNSMYTGGQVPPGNSPSYGDVAAPPLPPRSQQYVAGAQQFTSPRYRTPPPYRPPPGLNRSHESPGPQYPGSHGSPFSAPQYHSQMSPSNGPSNHKTGSPLPMLQQTSKHNPRSAEYVPNYSSQQYPPDQRGRNYEEAYHPDGNYRRGSVASIEPSDLGIPPAPMPLMRSNSQGNGSQSPMNVSSSHLPMSQRPNALPVQPMPSLAQVPPPAAGYNSSADIPQLKSTKFKSKAPPILNAFSHMSSSSASATPSPVAENSPVAPLRRHKENKENHRPSLSNSESSTNSRQVS